MDWWGCAASGDVVTSGARSGSRQRAEFRIEAHLMPAPSLGIEKRTPLDRLIEHFLQRHGLRAKLDLVGPMGLGTAALILNRQRFGRIAMKLDYVGDAGNTEGKGTERNAAEDTNTVAALAAPGVHALMQQSSFCGCDIFGPQLLDVD